MNTPPSRSSIALPPAPEAFEEMPRTVASPPPAPVISGPWLQRDAIGVQEKAAFPDRPFLVRHRLVGHPLLTLEGILALVDRVPARHVDWHPADVPLDLEGRPPKPPADPRDLIRQIEVSRSWLGVDKAHVDPEIRTLSREFVAEVGEAFAGRLRDVHDIEAYLFVSSPGARKPIHVDPEHNFLLQIRGTKTIHLWDGNDREIVPETLLESFATTDDWAGLPVRRGDRPPTFSFHLEPGVGLYFPVLWPHAVENGSDEASVSVSFTFRSGPSRRRETLRQMNAKLRRLGISPRPPDISRWSDSLKLGVMGLGRGAKNLFRSRP